MITCPMCGGSSRKLGYSGNKSGSVVHKYQCKVCARHFIESTVIPVHLRLEYLNDRIGTLTTVRDMLLKQCEVNEEGNSVVESRSNEIQVSS